jgi:hypothetical protein
MAPSTSKTRELVYWGLAIFSLVLLIAAITVKQNHDRTVRYREVIRDLRQQYPFESLESRLPTRSGLTQRQPLSTAAKEQLRDFESAITNEMEGTGREARLQKLHEGTVEKFVQKEGFGVMRMVGSYAESVMANGYQTTDGWVGRNKTAVPQVVSVLSPTWQEADLRTEPSFNFLSLHRSNMVHFVHPNGFGTMHDLRNVAGFQPHQFNAIHEEKPWKVLRLELVGLLLEDQPRVYVTATLPRMQDVRAVPTRSLDAFEAAGLEQLQGGEPLFVRNVPDGVRMLGAIRRADQCSKCHAGERGDLLGAFSYALQRE